MTVPEKQCHPSRRDDATTIYRPFSPSRGSAGPAVSTDRAAVVGMVSALNQGCLTLDGATPDWAVQSGEVNWRTL